MVVTREVELRRWTAPCGLGTIQVLHDAGRDADTTIQMTDQSTVSGSRFQHYDPMQAMEAAVQVAVHICGRGVPLGTPGVASRLGVPMMAGM